MTAVPGLYPDGTPEYAVSWARYKVAQATSNREPLPAEMSWLHPAAGSAMSPKELPEQTAKFWAGRL